MTETFRAIRLHKTDAGQELRFEDLTLADLMAGDVTVQVDYSTVNYKDGLALTGKAPIVRVWPLIPGIDFAGVVETSDNAGFKPGDRVVLNGWGVGETHHGGYAGKARVGGDWLVKLPDAISTAQAMAIGTAGYTAMLCVMALERQGVTPDKGDILVTGAAGGVGSVAIALLAGLGYRVVASSGRKATEGDYLTGLGAADIVDRAEFAAPGAAAGPRALGRRGRRGRQPHAGQRARPDPLRRRGGRLRPGPGHGPARQRRAVHPARDHPLRYRLGDGPEGPARGGLASARRRPRPGETGGHAGRREASRHPGARRHITEGKVRGRVVVDVNA